MDSKLEYGNYVLPQKKSSSKTFFLFLVVAAFFTIRSLDLSKSSPKIVASTENVIGHLQQLEKIAIEHGNSRSIINGHLACAAYVVEQISQFKDTWKVWTEDVPLTVQVDNAPPVMSLYLPRTKQTRNYEPRTEVAIMTGSGSVVIYNAPLIFPDTCDFAYDQKNAFVAIIDATKNSKDCSSCARMGNAIEAGAKALIFIGQPGNQNGYPHSMPPSPGRCGRVPGDREKMAKVGVVSLGDKAAFEFLSLHGSNPDAKVSIKVDSKLDTFISKNVLAETLFGDSDNVVLFGSHLDGVPAGPGVNDDGTGAMGTLELASAFAKSSMVGKNKQKIRLAFWTGEEIGLLGSEAYVKSLLENNPNELKRIRLTIDTDMIASPNFIRGVYDGTKIEDEKLRVGSVAIQNLFVNYFKDKGLLTDFGYFDGRSDYAPFMDQKIPSGGLFTGADAIKTPKQAEMFGGLSGVPLDPCYHQDCDRMEQLQGPGLVVLKQNMDAMAHALEVFAASDINSLLSGGVY